MRKVAAIGCRKEFFVYIKLLPQSLRDSNIVDVFPQEGAYKYISHLKGTNHMRISKISELSGGSFELFLLIKEIQTKTARNGSTFLTFIFTDGSENLSANMWDTSADALEVSAKEIAYVTLEGKPYNGKMSYTVERIRPSYPSEGISLTDFIPCSQIPPETLYDFCLSKIEKMADTELSALVKEIYVDNKDKLLWQSAAKSVHHNKVGELLWHVARMVKMAGASADTYGVLNRDMLLAGVLLHDIGKLIELSTDEMGITEYTKDGYLFGHAFLGIEMVKKYAEKLGTSEEKVRCLTHIIASHHGSREFGAISVPATAEAYAVHCIDLIDSRMYIYEEALNKTAEDSFSDPIHVLEGTRIYKPLA